MNSLLSWFDSVELCAKHTWKQQGRLILIYLGIMVVVILALLLTKNGNWFSGFANIVGAATLGVSLFVWFGARKQQWQASLPKQLTVVYFYQEQPVMVCERATLLAEAEIRASAQQMGAQLAGERFLSLGPVFQVIDPVNETANEEDHRAVRHYQIWMTLTQLPSKLETMRQESSSPCVLVRRVKGTEFQDFFDNDYQLTRT